MSSSKVRQLYTEGSQFVPRERNKIINWGLSTTPAYINGRGWTYNSFANVKVAANKLETFNTLRAAGNIPIPEYTADRAIALEWLANGAIIFCRTKLNGHSGAGIVLVAREEDLPASCPLYVKSIKKKFEYRVHVAFGNVIDVQQKRKRTDYTGEIDYAVRNHHTGWVYCRDSVDITERLQQYAKDAVAALGLHFGAVDIIYNQHYDAYYVLEVNCAPGLEGTTVEKYAQAFHGELF